MHEDRDVHFTLMPTSHRGSSPLMACRRSDAAVTQKQASFETSPADEMGGGMVRSRNAADIASFRISSRGAHPSEVANLAAIFLRSPLNWRHAFALAGFAGNGFRRARSNLSRTSGTWTHGSAGTDTGTPDGTNPARRDDRTARTDDHTRRVSPVRDIRGFHVRPIQVPPIIIA